MANGPETCVLLGHPEAPTTSHMAWLTVEVPQPLPFTIEVPAGVRHEARYRPWPDEDLLNSPRKHVFELLDREERTYRFVRTL